MVTVAILGLRATKRRQHACRAVAGTEQLLAAGRCILGLKTLAELVVQQRGHAWRVVLVLLVLVACELCAVYRQAVRVFDGRPLLRVTGCVWLLALRRANEVSHFVVPNGARLRRCHILQDTLIVEVNGLALAVFGLVLYYWLSFLVAILRSLPIGTPIKLLILNWHHVLLKVHDSNILNCK